MINIDQFNQEFEEIRKPLKSYLLRITASVADTEDLVQDTYLQGLEKLGDFRGESTLKTWLFAIASNKAKNNLKARTRWVEQVTDLSKEAALSDPDFFKEAMYIRHSSSQGDFEIREHITFCFTCISKSLPLEQQICLLLKEVYEFKMNEISLILDCSEAMVKYYLHTGRAKMEDIFEGRCALIRKEGVCHQCSELNGIFNPKQKIQEELMKIEMAKARENKDKAHLFDLRMKIIREIDPFESKAAELQLHHLAFNSRVMEKFLKKKED